MLDSSPFHLWHDFSFPSSSLFFLIFFHWTFQTSLACFMKSGDLVNNPGAHLLIVLRSAGNILLARIYIGQVCFFLDQSPKNMGNQRTISLGRLWKWGTLAWNQNIKPNFSQFRLGKDFKKNLYFPLKIIILLSHIFWNKFTQFNNCKNGHP